MTIRRNRTKYVEMMSMSFHNVPYVQIVSLLGVKAWGISLGIKVCGTISTALLNCIDDIHMQLHWQWLAAILHYLALSCISIASSGIVEIQAKAGRSRYKYVQYRLSIYATLCKNTRKIVQIFWRMQIISYNYICNHEQFCRWGRVLGVKTCGAISLGVKDWGVTSTALLDSWEPLRTPPGEPMWTVWSLC